MKRFVIGLCLGVLLPPAATLTFAQVDQKLAIVDEKLDRLHAEVEALQFRQQRFEEQLEALQQQVRQLRLADDQPTAADLAALETRIKAVDAAREKDRQIILDTLSKEMASLVSTTPTTASGKVHEVKAGETLGVIARLHGVTVVDIVRANNLADPNAIQIGQKLTIPK